MLRRSDMPRAVHAPHAAEHHSVVSCGDVEDIVTVCDMNSCTDTRRRTNVTAALLALFAVNNTETCGRARAPRPRSTRAENTCDGYVASRPSRFVVFFPVPRYLTFVARVTLTLKLDPPSPRRGVAASRRRVFVPLDFRLTSRLHASQLSYGPRTAHRQGRRGSLATPPRRRCCRIFACGHSCRHSCSSACVGTLRFYSKD